MGFFVIVLAAAAVFAGLVYFKHQRDVAKKARIEEELSKLSDCPKKD